MPAHKSETNNSSTEPLFIFKGPASVAITGFSLMHRLEGFPKEAKTSPQSVELAVENHQFSVRHDEWSATANRVNVILVCGRHHLRCNVLTATTTSVLNLCERDCPVRIEEKGLHGDSVLIINLHVGTASCGRSMSSVAVQRRLRMYRTALLCRPNPHHQKKSSGVGSPHQRAATNRRLSEKPKLPDRSSHLQSAAMRDLFPLKIGSIEARL